MSAEGAVICCFSALQRVSGFHDVTRKNPSPVWLLNLHSYMRISARVGASTHLYMKKFYKSQRDPYPSRQVDPGLEKGYPVRRVDPGWFLRSCKHLLQIDHRRADPLERVEANPG